MVVTPGDGDVALVDAEFVPNQPAGPFSQYPCQMDSIEAETAGLISGIDVSTPDGVTPLFYTDQAYQVVFAFSDVTVNVGSGLQAYGSAPALGREKFRWNSPDSCGGSGWSSWSLICVNPPGDTPSWIGWDTLEETQGRWQHVMDGTSEYDDRYVREAPEGIVTDGCHALAVSKGLGGSLGTCQELPETLDGFLPHWVPLINSSNGTDSGNYDFNGYHEDCVTAYRTSGTIDAINTSCSAIVQQPMEMGCIKGGTMKFLPYDEYTITYTITATEVMVMKTGTAWQSKVWP